MNSGSQAFVDVIVEAHPIFSLGDVSLCECGHAGTKRIQLTKKVEQHMSCTNRRVWAKVVRAIVQFATCQENPGERLFLDANPGIGLVVLEHDVVARLILLDEVVLQQQGFRLRLHHDELDVGNLAHQHPSLTRLFLIEIR